MKTFIIKPIKEDLKHHFQFLRSIEREKFLLTHKKDIQVLVGINLVYLLLFTATKANDFITPKAVFTILLALIWLYLLFYIINYLNKIIKRNSAINKIIEKALNVNETVNLSFDNEKLIIDTGQCSTDLKWSYFKAYLENLNSIFLFPEGSLYSCMSISMSDIGEENYSDLKCIVKEKIKQLKID